MDWKGVWEKVLAALIGAAILGVITWFWGSYNAPESPAIRPLFTWIELRNPAYFSRDASKAAEIDKALGVSGLGAFLRSSSRTVRLGTLVVRNVSRVRSKPIEITVDGGGLFRNDEKSEAQEFKSQTVLQPIDGRGEQTLIVVSYLGSFGRPPIKIVYEDRTLDIAEPIPLPHDFLFGVMGGPFALLVVALFGIIGVVFVLLGIVIQVGSWLYPDFIVKNLSEGQVRKMIEQLRQVRDKYPEKLPKDPVS